MKGTDVTPEQISHAETFVMKSATGGYDRPVICIRREDFFRMVAWYAAVRVESGLGVGEFGPIEVKDIA